MPTKKIELHGILKHANVCRVLCRNDITAYQFYIIARVCSENLPPATLASLHHEMTMRNPRVANPPKNPYFATRARVMGMVNKGLLQVRKANCRVIVEPTLTGWKFFILTLAEMERPVRDQTIFDSPRKLVWNTNRQKRKHGAKEKAARKAFSIVKAAKPIGLSIWQRCGAASIPPFQRLRLRRRPSTAPKSSAPASTATESRETSAA